MAEPKPVLQRNWTKAGLGLLYCKEGLQDFVSDVVDNFQRQTYTNIGGRCNTCTTQNVLTCPTPGICNTRRCNFHDNADPTKNSTPCPQIVCRQVRDEVIQEHRYGKPSFRNTKAEDWSCNSWEIAKCYMAPTGYLDIQTSDDTDFTGLISVILNFKPLQNHVNENLAMPGNLFEQGRECRNSIMHNAKMEVSTADLRNHLQILKRILTDPITIQHLPNAQSALRKIIDLENDVVVITKEDEIKLREESKRALQEDIAEGIRCLNVTRDQGLHELRKTIKEGTNTLEREKRDARLRATQEKVDENNLQKEVIQHYQTNGYCKSAIPVLIDDEEIDIQEFYVKPIMEVKQDKNSDPDYYGSTVSSIHELFPHETIRRVCIQGEAGYGKTSFCKHLIASWCKVHLGNNTGKLCEKDIAFLKSLDLLFYIPLRNYEIADVNEIIKQELVRKGLHDILTNVLGNESEKCLIILDGLDEYSSGLPKIDTRENYKIIFTSRPWKIESLRAKQHLLGRIVELTEMEENDDLIKAVVESLNKKEGKQLDWTKFKYCEYDKKWSCLRTTTLQYKKIRHLAEIPVILIQMVCMWFDGEELGSTRTDIYTSMLQYLFRVAEKCRPEAVQKYLSKQNIDTLTRKSFKDLKIINDLFSGLIFKIADFAFHTLFNNEQGELLVFSHSDMCIDPFWLSEQDIEFCLSLGILSQEKIQRKSTKQEKSISFLHKTFQEFFAAIHIAFSRESVLREILGKIQVPVSGLFRIPEVLFFVVGISFRHTNEISNHISRIVDTDEHILNYRMSTETGNHEVDIVQDLLCDLIDERQVDDPEERPLIELHDVILTKGDDRVQNSLLPYLNIESVKSLSVKDVDLLRDTREMRIASGLKYLVKLAAVVQTQEDVDIITGIIDRSCAHLKCIVIGPPSCKKVDRFGAFIETLVTVDKLCCLSLRCVAMKHEDFKLFGQCLTQFRHLEELSLNRITCAVCSHKQCTCSIRLPFSEQLSRLELEHLDGHIMLGSLPSLKSAKLIDIEIVQLDLSIYKQLHDVELWYISCTTCTSRECCCTVDLRYNKQLKILELQRLKRQVVLDPLHSLERVTLEYSKDLTHVLHQLTNSSCLRYLSLTRNKVHRRDADQQVVPKGVITGILPTLPSLHTLVLEGIDIDDDDLIIPREMKHLKEVRLGDLGHPVTMTLQCVKRFIDNILQVQHTTTVHMWRVHIRPSQDTREAYQYIRDNCRVTCGGIRGRNDRHDEDGEHDTDNRYIDMFFKNTERH